MPFSSTSGGRYNTRVYGALNRSALGPILYLVSKNVKNFATVIHKNQHEFVPQNITFGLGRNPKSLTNLDD